MVLERKQEYYIKTQHFFEVVLPVYPSKNKYIPPSNNGGTTQIEVFEICAWNLSLVDL